MKLHGDLRLPAGPRTCFPFIGFLLAAAPGWSEACALTIAEKGEARAEIVVAPEASPPVRHAAHELARFLHEITGGDFVISASPREPGRHLFVGPGAARQADADFAPESLGEEGIVLRTVGDDLIVAGGEPRGTLYAVYTFLEDILGCRWYTPQAEFIPCAPTLELPPLDIVHRPSFEYREPFYSPAWDPDWAARNKCNGHHARLDDKRGGKIVYGRWCHTFGRLIPDSEYFDDHPEYFSLVDGRRISSGQHTGQICLADPDVLKTATARVRAWIRGNPEASIWGISQNDNDFGYCRCSNCAALAADEGSQSGPILRFVNAIADEVAREHPDILIDTLAYQYSLDPPGITRPRPNVRVRLCSISCCQLHPYAQCDHPRTIRFMRALRGWMAVTDNLYVWHYNTNFAHFLMPMPDLDELCADIPMYKRSGVKGLFMQGGGNDRYQGRFGAGFMDELKTYLIAKMLWDADRDPRKVIDDFLDGYFGKAAAAIGEYLELLHGKVRQDNVHGMLCETPDWPYLSSDLLERCDQLFDEAEHVAESPIILARVKHARLSIEYVQVLQEVRRSLGLDRLPAQMTTPDYVRAMREVPATDLAVREAGKAKALAWLEDFIERCEADGMTTFGEVPYSVRSYFEALSAPLESASVMGGLTASASSSHPSRLPARAIDGSGRRGEMHDTAVDNMFLSGDLAASAAHPRRGTATGSHWLQVEFDEVTVIREMRIWNYHELAPDFRSMGFKEVTIEYSTTGGADPDDWTTVYEGQIPITPAREHAPVSRVVDFNRVRAKYVAITAAPGRDRNWSDGRHEEAGLSEIVFATGDP